MLRKCSSNCLLLFEITFIIKSISIVKNFPRIMKTRKFVVLWEYWWSCIRRIPIVFQHVNFLQLMPHVKVYCGFSRILRYVAVKSFQPHASFCSSYNEGYYVSFEWKDSWKLIDCALWNYTSYGIHFTKCTTAELIT